MPDVQGNVFPVNDVEPGDCHHPRYRWHWRTRLPERRGQVFRVVCRGAMNGALIEFADGFRAVTSRNALRRVR